MFYNSVNIVYIKIQGIVPTFVYIGDFNRGDSPLLFFKYFFLERGENMKKITLVAAVLVLGAMATSASAANWSWSNGLTAHANGGASGFNGTQMDGLNATGALSEGASISDTDTSPLQASNDSVLNQATGGLGVSGPNLTGSLVQNGATNSHSHIAGDDCGDYRFHANARTTTAGSADLAAAAAGDNTMTIGGLAALSDESSSTSVSPWNTDADADAEQIVIVGAGAYASGDDLSTASVAVTAESKVTARENGGGSF